jgi:hypothetical protein
MSEVPLYHTVKPAVPWRAKAHQDRSYSDPGYRGTSLIRKGPTHRTTIGPYRGTSLIRNCPPHRTTMGP